MVSDDPPPATYRSNGFVSSGFDDLESDWPPKEEYVGGAERYKNKAWKNGWSTGGRRTEVRSDVRDMKMPTMMATYGDYTLKQALNNMPHLAGLDFLVRELCKREHMRGGDRGVLRLLDHIQSLTISNVLDK